MGFLRKLLSDKSVEKRYVAAGADFGDAVSYLYMGECVGFEKMLSKWEGWEEEYERRGYRTVCLDDFVGLGGHGQPLGDALSQKRDDGETPVHYAKIYRQAYLHRTSPTIDLAKMMEDGQPQFGTYIVPSIPTLRKNKK